jgi:flagellar basal body-associated protein FliL
MSDELNEQEDDKAVSGIDIPDEPDSSDLDIGQADADELNADKTDADTYDVDETDAEDVEAVATKAPGKRKRGKGRIILLAAAIVLVAVFGGGGIAYATQHDNPHFCNAICHTPMDPYVESYDNNLSVNAAEAETTGPDGAQLSVTLHKNSDQDINCLTCHNDGIDAQIQEGIAWVSGNYVVPLEGFSVVSSANPKEGEVSGVEFCLREGCHEATTLDELKETTADVKVNGAAVHNGQHGYTNCSLCHQTHEQSVLYCASSGCHVEVTMPEGWTVPKATK